MREFYAVEGTGAHPQIYESNVLYFIPRYCAMMPAEICEYPDSKKIGAFGGGLRHMTRANDNVDCWTGES